MEEAGADGGLWENDGQKKYISGGKFIFSLSLSFSQVCGWEIPRGRDGVLM